MKIAQDQHYEGQDWWAWSVWLDCTDEELREIEAVLWHLHPTFPNPDVRKTNRAEKFRLKTSGWGTFRIRADVVLTSGKTCQLTHDLMLLYPDGQPTTA